MTGALNNLAWILATDPNPEVRKGTEAVQLAVRACELTQYKEAMILGTLGTAYAEAGRFEEAITAAQRAEALALAAGNSGIAAKNHELTKLFSSRRAYHEVTATESTNSTKAGP
jgi:hypothetical protein